jgi:hypothetical protein
LSALVFKAAIECLLQHYATDRPASHKYILPIVSGKDGTDGAARLAAETPSLDQAPTATCFAELDPVGQPIPANRTLSIFERIKRTPNGLAPVLVDQLIEVLRKLADDKIGLLLVEQNLRVATSVASNVAIMLSGQITATVPAATLKTDEALQRKYLGVSTGSH